MLPIPVQSNRPVRGSGCCPAATAQVYFVPPQLASALLAKIENNQFESVEQIDLAAVMQKYLRQFDELIKDKQLVVTAALQQSFPVKMHPFLADSLASNLLGNAIKYNVPGGILVVTSTGNTLSIENTSTGGALEENTLFQRFHAVNGKEDSSNGLGLPIVRKIAENNGLKVSYKNIDGRHVFTIQPDDQ